MKAPVSGLVLLASFAAEALAQSGSEAAIPAPASSAEPSPAVRAGFWWADYDRDGLEDAFAIGADGTAKLLRNSGDGSFSDVTMLAGLDGLDAATFAAWQDFDRDSAPDVFVGTPSGSGHLLRNAGDGTFQDVTQFVGLMHSGKHLAAQWLDYDLDGLVDLAVRTEDGEHLYHALSNGHFETIDLGRAQPQTELASGAAGVEEPDTASDITDRGKSAAQRRRSAASALPPPTSLGSAPMVPSWSHPGGTLNLITCPDTLKNQATATCISASSTPTLGWLYPLTIHLNVNGAGNVGIGTTSPSFKLDVAGTARIADTLTLNPAGDQALQLLTGSIYKEGVIFEHTKGGGANTALGKQALSSATNGSYDTATGYRALQYNTSGFANTAFGEQAMRMNTTGIRNTAVASYALRNNTTGSSNTAAGYAALFANTTGSRNTAVAVSALQSNTQGNDNTGVGFSALASNTFGYENTATGSYALATNTTGTRNTAFGRDALRYNTDGTANTAAGRSALMSNSSGIANTAVGSNALRVSSTGSFNTACGTNALLSNTTGGLNTALGFTALYQNTVGSRNTAIGQRALYGNAYGLRNTAVGDGALRSNTSGNESTAVGYKALYASTATRNLAIGARAGLNVTSGYDNIEIGNVGTAADTGTIRIGASGNQTRTFIAGIRGITTGNANAIPVVIDSAGQLGTVSSSRRFKKEIVDMGDTSRLLELRPVRFRYKQEQKLPDGSEAPPEYGLIAEEVAEVFPDLVVHDDEGKPFTVKYHLLSSMLLNELERLTARLDAKEREHSAELAELRARLDALEARVTAEK